MNCGQGGCFIGSTLILLYDGSVCRIADLDGQSVDVYSKTKSGKLVKGRARGRMTKRVKMLMLVTLDNGYSVKCTPEHRWMRLDGTYIEARHMEVAATRLMPIGFGETVGLESIRAITYQDSVPVFDLEVDEYHNFALNAGVIVHNSKDCADALAGVVYTLSKKSSYRASIEVGISEHEDTDSKNKWIRETMTRSGDKPLQQVGDVPSSGKPIVFSG